MTWFPFSLIKSYYIVVVGGGFGDFFLKARGEKKNKSFDRIFKKDWHFIHIASALSFHLFMRDPGAFFLGNDFCFVLFLEEKIKIKNYRTTFGFLSLPSSPESHSQVTRSAILVDRLTMSNSILIVVGDCFSPRGVEASLDIFFPS